MKRRRGNGVSSALETAGQGARHTPPSSCPRYRKRYLLIIQPFDHSLRYLDRATPTPSLASQTNNHRPSADEVMDSTFELQRVQASFRGCIEVIIGSQALAHRRGLSTRQRDCGFVAQRESQRVIPRGLGHHSNWDRTTQPIMKVADESISDAEQFVRSRAGYGNLDTALETAPKRPEISSHDR